MVDSSCSSLVEEKRAEEYHQLVLIWVRDPAKFDEYLRRLLPVVGRYGGAGDRSFRPAAAFERDPRHERIETELYPAAVARSVWITGAVAS